MTVYQKEEVVKTNELERDVGGLLQKDTRKKKFKDRSLVIEHYSKLLKDDKIRVGRFLQLMSNMDNKVVIQEHEYPSFSETDDTSPVVLATTSSVSETVMISKRKYTKKTHSTDKSIVLTRSKARKAAIQEKSVSKKRPIDECNLDCVESEDNHTNSAKKTKESTEPIGSDESSDLDAVTTLTSTTTEIDRLHKHFENIYNEKVEVKLSITCVMECGRPKGTVLLPCQHQPTCNQCFVMWRVFVDQKGENQSVFCPSCRKKVTNSIAIKH